MKNKLNRFAQFGLEDDTEVVEAVEIDETKTDEVAELETEVAEGEVVEVDGDIAEMTDTVESLEAICAGIRSTYKFGGLNRQGAAFALQSVDLQLARLGLEGIRCSVEDFEVAPAAAEGADPIADDIISAGGEADPLNGDNKTSVEPDANVAVSQEAETTIREKIAKIWQAIKDAITSFLAKVKDWFLRVFEESARVAKSAKAMKEKIQELESTSVKKDDIDVAGYVNKLSLDGKTIPSAKQIATAILPVSSEMFNTFPKAVTARAEKVATEVKGINWKDDASFDKVYASITGMDVLKLSSTKGDASSVASVSKMEGTKKRTDMLPGMQYLVGVYDDANKTSKFMVVDAMQATAPKELKVKPPSKGELAEYCQSAEDIASNISDFKRTFQATEKAKNDLKAAGDAAEKGATEAGKPQQFSKLASIISNNSMMIDKPCVEFNKYSIKLAKSLVAYASTHYSNFASAKQEAKAMKEAAAA